MIAKSLFAFSTDDLKAKIAENCTRFFNPSLAFVFSSIKYDLNIIQKIFQEFSIDLLGSTTAGEISDDRLLEEGMAILLLELPKESYKIDFFEHNGVDVDQTGFKVGETAKVTFNHPGMIILSGGITIDAESLVNSIKKRVGNTVPIFGGLAGDDLQMKNSFVFTHKNITSNGLAVLFVDQNKVSINGQAISGWAPIGGINTITEAKGNVIYQINNERAFDVFAKYFGFFDEATDKIDQLITLQTNYPFQFIRDENVSVLRSPMKVNQDDGTILLTASVKEGDQFRFSFAPDFKVIDQTLRTFKNFKPKANDPDAILHFSCKGRHGAFGPILKKEIKGIYDIWDKPVAGFLTYGEIGNVDSLGSEFHNETCSIAFLKVL